MKNYKDKSDVDFAKYVELQEAIKDDPKNEMLVIYHTQRLFNPYNLEHFAMALITDGKPKLSFDVDLNFAKASKFIDCDILSNGSDADRLEFLKIVCKKKRFRKLSISIADAEEVLRLFINAQPK